MKIREIYCFGTSYTAGGGFEWGDGTRGTLLGKHYHEQPQTQMHYSWPGQLQKIVGPDVKVINLGRSGYGYDRTIRLAYDIIENSKELDDKLFLFEFSWLGRKELWSNTFRDYVVANYSFHSDGTSKLEAIADRYYSPIHQKIFRTLQPKVEPFTRETISFEIEEKHHQMHTKIFIDYLLYNKVNFKVLQSFFSIDRHKEPVPAMWNPVSGMIHMLDFTEMDNPDRSKTIEEETDGEVQDLHGGFEWVKKIALRVANEIGMNNYPIEPYVKQNYTKSLI